MGNGAPKLDTKGNGVLVSLLYIFFPAAKDAAWRRRWKGSNNKWMGYKRKKIK